MSCLEAVHAKRPMTLLNLLEAGNASGPSAIALSVCCVSGVVFQTPAIVQSPLTILPSSVFTQFPYLPPILFWTFETIRVASTLTAHIVVRPFVLLREASLHFLHLARFQSATIRDLEDTTRYDHPCFESCFYHTFGSHSFIQLRWPLAQI